MPAAADGDSLDTDHLLLAMLDQEGGMIERILKKLKKSVPRVREDARKVVYGGQQPSGASLPPGEEVYVTPRMKRAFDLALEEASRLGDAYIGNEHILLAMMKIPEGTAWQIIQGIGIAREDVLDAVRKIRGTKKADDASAEEKYEALERFTRDVARTIPCSSARRASVKPLSWKKSPRPLAYARGSDNGIRVRDRLLTRAAQITVSE